MYSYVRRHSVFDLLSHYIGTITIICTLSKFYNDSDEDRTIEVQVNL